MRTSRKTDFRSRDIAKNNFSGIDITQGLDMEPPSFSPYFLLVTVVLTTCCRQKEMREFISRRTQVVYPVNQFNRKRKKKREYPHERKTLILVTDFSCLNCITMFNLYISQ